MQNETQFTNQEVTIREILRADIEQLRIWRNREDIRTCFVNNQPISKEQQEKWYETYLTKENEHMFIIECQAKPVGAVGIYDLNTQTKTATFGRFMIGELDARKKGIAVKAVNLACAYAFEFLNVELIVLEVFKDNLPARKTYEKAGFIQSGTTTKNNRQLLTMQLHKS